MRPTRIEFTRAALIAEIASMLEELGNPPLVDRIFPQGWQNADDARLNSLFDLCIRTYKTRSAEA